MVKRFLVADVGATKTDLAVYSSDLGPSETLASATKTTAQYATFDSLIAAFLQSTGQDVDSAVFAVAGPVIDGCVTKTSSHLPWTLDRLQLQQVLKLDSLHLINDVEATATAIPHLAPNHLHTLHAGTPEKQGTLAVIAPGTGLGEAFLLWEREGYRTCISEGGHAGFSSSRPIEAELAHYVQEIEGYASAESVCSGMGLPTIYKCLKEGGHAEEPARLREQLATAKDHTTVLVQAALSPAPCELIDLTFTVFTSILGSQAGNLALTVVATGGVFLAGGIPPRIFPMLNRELSTFRRTFCNRGVMTEVMERIPVHVVTYPHVGLLGAYWTYQARTSQMFLQGKK